VDFRSMYGVLFAGVAVFAFLLFASAAGGLLFGGVVEVAVLGVDAECVSECVRVEVTLNVSEPVEVCRVRVLLVDGGVRDVVTGVGEGSCCGVRVEAESWVVEGGRVAFGVCAEEGVPVAVGLWLCGAGGARYYTVAPLCGCAVGG